MIIFGFYNDNRILLQLGNIILSYILIIRHKKLLKKVKYKNNKNV